MSDSLRTHGIYSPWNSPGQNTGVGSCSLLQGIFPTQGSNPGLLHCRRVLYQLSHKVSPRILEWVTCYFSSGSSWPKNRTGVSCTAGGFFTNWAVREALGKGKDVHHWGLGQWLHYPHRLDICWATKWAVYEQVWMEIQAIVGVKSGRTRLCHLFY